MDWNSYNAISICYKLLPSATFNLLPQRLQISVIERQQIEFGIQFNRLPDSRLRLVDVTELAGIAPEVEVRHRIAGKPLTACSRISRAASIAFYCPDHRWHSSTERNIDARFDITLQRDNSNYMSSALKISLTRIGNSRGIRLPAPLIKKFGFDGFILLEEEGDRLVLKPLKRGKAEKLPWSETAREMASAREDWSDWEPSEKDGLQEIPWESSDQRKSQP